MPVIAFTSKSHSSLVQMLIEVGFFGTPLSVEAQANEGSGEKGLAQR
jgi:hypothetical protein